MSTTSIRYYEELRMVGLITGLVWAGFAMLNTARGLIQIIWSGSSLPMTDHIQVIITILVVFFIIAPAWRRPCIGGIALTVVWLIKTILYVVISLDYIRMMSEQGLWLWWVVPQFFHLLLLVSGVLFILSGRKKQTITDETAAQIPVIDRLRLSGLIAGLVAGIMYIQNVSESIFYLVFLGAGLVTFGSVALAWKRPLVGGIVLIAESLWPLAILIASPLFPSSEALGLAMIWMFIPVIAIMLCFPLLVSGVLFLLSLREGRKHLSRLKDVYSD